MDTFLISKKTYQQQAKQAGSTRSARQLITTLFGGMDKFSIISIVVMLMLLGWATDTLFEAFSILRSEAFSVHRALGALVSAAPVLILILWLTTLHRKARTRFEKAVLSAQSLDVQPRHRLVIFLSHNREQAQNVMAPVATERRSVQSNWRIPLEAIHAHASKGTLKEVWIIGSSGGQSSHQQIPHFVELLNACLPDAQTFKVRTLADIAPESWGQGIDFDNLSEIVDALETIRLHITQQEARNDLIVDITGGKSITSSAATLVCYSQGIAFQYVDCPGEEVYQIREYSLKMEVPD